MLENYKLARFLPVVEPMATEATVAELRDVGFGNGATCPAVDVD